jgi:hypothetical protein|tara:strand:- start:207 stop:332 length:126 start_codon:yes stop_codon:yes gene_type:complete
MIVILILVEFFTKLNKTWTGTYAKLGQALNAKLGQALKIKM